MRKIKSRFCARGRIYDIYYIIATGGLQVLRSSDGFGFDSSAINNTYQEGTELLYVGINDRRINGCIEVRLTNTEQQIADRRELTAQICALFRVHSMNIQKAVVRIGKRCQCINLHRRQTIPMSYPKNEEPPSD